MSLTLIPKFVQAVMYLSVNFSGSCRTYYLALTDLKRALQRFCFINRSCVSKSTVCSTRSSEPDRLVPRRIRVNHVSCVAWRCLRHRQIGVVSTTSCWEVKYVPLIGRFLPALASKRTAAHWRPICGADYFATIIYF